MVAPAVETAAPAIRAISHPSTNRRILDLVLPLLTPQSRLLDLGAGEGFFSRAVGDFAQARLGVRPAELLAACDVTPGLFRYPHVACDLLEAEAPLPYPDNHFDVVCSVEVVEHVQDQFRFCREIVRVLKPGGTAIVSTPNVLNMNSRLRVLHSGFATLFNPLSLSSNDVVHTSGHIHPVSYYYLGYALLHAGASTVGVTYDRFKRSAFVSLAACLPLLLAGNAGFRARLRRKSPQVAHENRAFLDAMNDWRMLTARSVVVIARKGAS